MDERKQAKFQWVRDPSQKNVDKLNNVRCEATRHLRNKKKASLKSKIEDLATNSKIRNVRDLHHQYHHHHHHNENDDDDDDDRPHSHYPQVTAMPTVPGPESGHIQNCSIIRKFLRD